MDTTEKYSDKNTRAGNRFCSEAFFADTGEFACQGQQTQQLWSSTDAISAATLLAQVELVGRQLGDLDNDIGLLMTVQNALDVLSDNLARVRRLTMQKYELACSAAEKARLNSEICQLAAVNQALIETTRFNNVPLFEDGSIRMTCSGQNELYLLTFALPGLEGLGTEDLSAALLYLENAAVVINDWYREVNSLMHSLQDLYQQLYSEIDLLRESRQDLKRGLTQA
jgi:hypothetical protein